MEIKAQLAQLAARGDEQALTTVRDILISQECEIQRRAAELVEVFRGSVQLTGEVRRKLLTISRSFLQLGDRDLAEALRLLANSSSTEPNSEQFRLSIRSDRNRRYELLRVDGPLLLFSLGLKCESGVLPGEIRLDTNKAYVLSVETDEDEPTVRVPMYIQSDTTVPEPLYISLEMWRGLGRDFVWVPEFKCSIGGDVAARDSLVLTSVQSGPLAVSLRHIRMKEYLVTLQNHGMLSMQSRYFPMYMGEPLVEFDGTNWKAVNLTVKEGHNWLDVPAVGIDFDCAKWYCSTLSLPDHLTADLLTEYEWEAVARGPDARFFPWGDTYVPGFSNIVTSKKDSKEGLESVGYRTTDVSAYGIFDCSGNAEEWCRFGETPEAEPGFAVARGGSWYNPVQPSRLASRVVRHSDYRHKKLTFRIAVRLKDN